MKLTAKRIAYIRNNYKFYDVGATHRLFGDCVSWDTTILAKSHTDAIKRANIIRGVGSGEHDVDNLMETHESNAYYKVKLHDKSDHFKNVKYYWG